MNMEQCIKECLDCYKSCLSTMSICLGLGGKHSEKKHVMLLTDCARMCQVSADFMLRESKSHKETCRLCADICKKCEKDCRGFEDEFMKNCADSCKTCAASCEEMAR